MHKADRRGVGGSVEDVMCEGREQQQSAATAATTTTATSTHPLPGPPLLPQRQQETREDDTPAPPLFPHTPLAPPPLRLSQCYTYFFRVFYQQFPFCLCILEAKEEMWSGVFVCLPLPVSLSPSRTRGLFVTNTLSSFPLCVSLFLSLLCVWCLTMCVVCECWNHPDWRVTSKTKNCFFLLDFFRDFCYWPALILSISPASFEWMSGAAGWPSLVFLFLSPFSLLSAVFLRVFNLNLSFPWVVGTWKRRMN